MDPLYTLQKVSWSEISGLGEQRGDTLLQKMAAQTLHFPMLNLSKEDSPGRFIFLPGQAQICLTTSGELDTPSKAGWIKSPVSNKQTGVALLFLAIPDTCPFCQEIL